MFDRGTTKLLRHIPAVALALTLGVTVTGCSTNSGSDDPSAADSSTPDSTTADVTASTETSSAAGESEAPSSAEEYEDEDYQSVVDDLEGAGFTNVSTEPLEDLIIGVLESDGAVDSVEIDGESDFESGSSFPSDAEVVVAYHSFPEEDEGDGGGEDGADDEDEVLTTKNSPDLVKLFKEGDYCSGYVKSFAKEYDGRTMEFDGNIGAIAPHGSYTTRYDMLVGAGDFSRTSQLGPAFQFRDVGTADLNLTGPNIPGRIKVGDEYRFTAEVDRYVGQQCLFLLDPIKTRTR